MTFQEEDNDKLAVEHAIWFTDVIRIVYKTAFKHGYKHGYNAGIAKDREEAFKGKEEGEG